MESKRVGIYARVSTKDQTTENQLLDLRKYCEARGWTVNAECVDQGISGSKDNRPALKEIMGLARKRKIDILCIWRLDRLFRSLRHLLATTDELQGLGVGLVSYSENMDLTTPQGKLILAVMGALGEFERCLIQERIHAGLRRARASGKRLGRPRAAISATTATRMRQDGRSLSQIALVLGVDKSTVSRLLRRPENVAA